MILGKHLNDNMKCVSSLLLFQAKIDWFLIGAQSFYVCVCMYVCVLAVCALQTKSRKTDFIHGQTAAASLPIHSIVINTQALF